MNGLPSRFSTHDIFISPHTVFIGVYCFHIVHPSIFGVLVSLNILKRLWWNFIIVADTLISTNCTSVFIGFHQGNGPY